MTAKYKADSKSLESFQYDFDNLTNTLSLELNFLKCKSMQFGEKNKKLRYFPEDQSSIQLVLAKSHIECELSIINYSDLR